MIKSKYFPQEETPIWVKQDILAKLYKPKKLRSKYLSSIKYITPIMIITMVMIVGVERLGQNPSTLISSTNNNETKLSTQTIISKVSPNTTSQTQSMKIQEELSNLEISLDELSKELNEQDISL